MLYTIFLSLACLSTIWIVISTMQLLVIKFLSYQEITEKDWITYFIAIFIATISWMIVFSYIY